LEARFVDGILSVPTDDVVIVSRRPRPSLCLSRYLKPAVVRTLVNLYHDGLFNRR